MSHGVKEGAFFLVSSHSDTQAPGLADPGKRGFSGADAGSELVYSLLAAVLCCCTRLEPWARIFEFYL
jgi:hypothetical protein